MGLKPSQIKPGMMIKYNNEKGEHVHAKITTRAGKSSGKHPNWWNTVRTDGSKEAVDFSRMDDITKDNAPNKPYTSPI